MTTLHSIYQTRRKKIAQVLKQRGIQAVRFMDFESMRNPAIRYLCGHPGDAILIISSDEKAILVPWDINMAEKMAFTDLILPYTKFGRSAIVATRSVLQELAIPGGSKIEVSEATAYPDYIDLVSELEAWDFICEKGGIDVEVLKMRAVKDEGELEIYERASALTNYLIDALEQKVRIGEITTELDAALFIEKECRTHGAEKTGFDTIAAGPTRSFGIHAFPSYGSGPFATKGFSILDFGIVVDGYTSDVTMTFAKGPLHKEQEKMLTLVQQAYDLAVAACKPGIRSRDVAMLVDDFFKEAKMTMPHSLGHGIGLEAHEAPGVNIRDDNDVVLVPGHIITIEPGLYHPEFGGVRLENDVLITKDGGKVLTSSRIVTL